MSNASTLRQFKPEPGLTYLDSATFGLPPERTLERVQEAMAAWQSGTADWISDWDQAGERCRSLVAGLMGTVSESISLQPAVSVASGIVATSVPRGGKVLVAEKDFTSVGYPFFEAERIGRLSVEEAPIEALAAAIDPSIDLVAFSLVQSSSGFLADLEAISRAAKKVGARVYVDLSQALGVLPFDVREHDVDFAACAAYKWLCCPRGVAFFYVRPDCWHAASAIAANWRAGDDPYGRYYGSPLALADNAARFDVSLAWHAWVGAQASLETLTELADETRFALANGAARAFTGSLGLPDPAAGIVSLAVSDGEALDRILREHRIKASSRGGRLRVSFHFYNTEEQALRVAELLRPYVIS